MTFEAILFDCDGVLVDSEPITNGVLRELLAESGWALTPAECVRIFIGKAVRDERALIAAHAHAGQRIACASGADRFKVEMQLAQVGLMDWFAGRIFSGQEMPRSKPAPDVYLAAAAHLGAVGARCLVIEDTVTGVTAGVAAGATVWAYCPLPEQGAALRQAGAVQLFERMDDLPGLLARA